MGLGILEPKNETHVAGTILLDETFTAPSTTVQSLKHSTGRNAHIILAPQPSNDPNDPLNWSSAEKHFILSILCFGMIVNAAALGPLLAAGFASIAAELQVSFTDVTLTSGYYLLVTGATGPFVSALARKYGKRPQFVFASLMGVIGCICGECAQNYDQLLTARFIQGFSTAAYESLVLAVIGDMFFVHQRAVRVSLVMFILAAINNGIAIIAGVITSHLGWHYNFHILLPFVTVQFILVVLFCPETTFRRDSLFNIDTSGSEKELAALAYVENLESGTTSEGAAENPNSRERETSALQRRSFTQRLSLWHGSFVPDSLLKMLLACPVILLNVGASFSTLVTGIIIAWYVAMSTISSIIFESPPYNFTAAGVGYTSVGPFIGGFLASAFMIWASDWVSDQFLRKNNGIYEPEFRLPLTSVAIVFAVAGLCGFGHAIENQSSIYLICFLWGILLFGLTIVAIVCTGYALDAFRDYSTEIFVMSMVFKNFFFYGLTNYIVEWYQVQGSARMFDTMGGMTAALCLTALPMYVWGKKYRNYWHHHNLIKILGLETDKTGTE